MNYSLHTVIIDRDGKLVANIEGNRFSADQLGDLVATTLQRRNEVKSHLGLPGMMFHLVSLIAQFGSEEVCARGFHPDDHGRFAVKASSCARENFLRTTTLVWRSSATRWKVVLPRSINRSDRCQVHAMILQLGFANHPTSPADPGGGPSR